MPKMFKETELQPCSTERTSAQHDPAHVSGCSPQNLSPASLSCIGLAYSDLQALPACFTTLVSMLHSDLVRY